MNKLTLVTGILLLGAVVVKGQESPVVQIKRDTIVLAKGTTYRFTVDTPEELGLVSAGADVHGLFQVLNVKGDLLPGFIARNNRGEIKTGTELFTGDRLQVKSKNGEAKTYFIEVKKMALDGQLVLDTTEMTRGTKGDVLFSYTAGQRSPDARVKFYIPSDLGVTLENTSVNVIGRGFVKLKDLSTQSVGRVGSAYPYQKVGQVRISKEATGTVLLFSGLDFRPANGPDLKVRIENVCLAKTGDYQLKAVYTTAQPEVLNSAGVGAEVAVLKVRSRVADFVRVLDKSLHYQEDQNSYTRLSFKWRSAVPQRAVQLLQSLDNGRTWRSLPAKFEKGAAEVRALLPQRLYKFRLKILSGEYKGFSNLVSFYSGKMDVGPFVAGTDDHTDGINRAIDSLNHIGGGTLVFKKGTYRVRTVHLKSNVYLYLDKGAVIKAIKGADAPETTWFSDKKYRSGLSPTDMGPYADPENYLTKQDVGHHYFRNAMFFGERLDNVKIIGAGMITGDGNLVNSDKVMNNAADNRADKMFSLKLCTNLEIGGRERQEDLWYDEQKDEPYYIGKNGEKLFEDDQMLKIERAGHFVLLATGTDHISVHDTYFGKEHATNARDIYDFMACNDVWVKNIYSKVSSDDIVKPGSDCALGFTRPASNYKVRNVIGDTNCNLFQIGSETADDISHVCVDNIYVLGANKAGFSISTNDGGHISDVHLNCGHTGPLHSRSKMYRAMAPFFISISNRGRIIGAEVGRYVFTENGKQHDELLVKNVNIGEVEDIHLKHIDVLEVYSGSSYNGTRWKRFDGSQPRSTPIVAGYQLPEHAAVMGGLDFKLPNGKHTGYIRNISFEDVKVLVKGGNPGSDTSNVCPELGVGQYNASNLKVQPSYGLWARHVTGLKLKDCSFRFEKPDGRYAIMLEDVHGAKLYGIQTDPSASQQVLIREKNSSDILTQE
ncbi:endopygalactorunase [Pedobacter sp. HMWF019]|uniref:endopygalactorunase n=1 Tax=Pedobacter sp. HMWF019 TaxID=2056856 RepID=UPI000D3A8C29|nr:endopygalactorunase [Pedobacter sp. HMWF019]PTT03483.1 endopygalactorunase [Pedobacter sp. HMWF019]